MVLLGSARRLPLALVGFVGLLACASAAEAQLRPDSRRELAPPVTLRSAADSDARRFLDQVEAHVGSEQWSDAIDKLRQTIRQYGDQLVPVESGAEGHRRYLSVRQYAHRRLVSLPRAARDEYRQAVDAQAREWFDEARRNRDPVLLRRIESELFNSSWTDDALWLLGEIELQRGDFAAARRAWLTLLPPSPESPELGELRYPDPAMDPADIAARLVLVSILEGDFRRAQRELHSRLDSGPGYAERFPDAQGRLAGRSGPWVELLDQWINESQRWEEPRRSASWPTYAGAPTRTHQAPRPLKLAGLAWDEPVPLQPISVLAAAISEIYSRERVGETSRHPLSYFPVLVGDLLLVHHRPLVRRDRRRCRDVILALNVRTGQPYWPTGRGEADDDRHPAEIFATQPGFFRTPKSQGLPRYTLTVVGTKLLARIGDPATGWTAADRGDQVGIKPPTLVCLDLAAQGRLLWQYEAEPGWSFDGTPVGDGERVYVNMRQDGQQARVHVACLDADDGRVLWRQFVAAAASRKHADEVGLTHNLLTLDGDTLFLNTNLGAIASLDTRDGRINWVTTNPRLATVDLNRPEGFFYRDLNPCVVAGEMVFAAPADSPEILALHRTNGRVLWTVDVPEATHLLGVVGSRLVAAGRRLAFVEFAPGQPETPGTLIAQHPAADGPFGYGRGALAAGLVYWPSVSGIHIFDAASTERVGLVELQNDPAFRTTAGNVLIGADHVVIAQSDRLIAFSQYSHRLRDELREITRNRPNDPEPWWELAECERELGLHREAATSYATCAELVAREGWPLGSTVEELRDEQVANLLLAADAAGRDGQWASAHTLAEQAASAARRETDRLAAGVLLAEVALEQNDPQRAIEHWTNLLSDPVLARLAIEDASGLPQPVRLAAQAFAARVPPRLAEPLLTHAMLPAASEPVSAASRRAQAAGPPLWQAVRVGDFAELGEWLPLEHPSDGPTWPVAVYWRDGTLSGVAVETGEVAWRTSLDGPPLWQGLRTSGLVVVTPYTVVCLDPLSGQHRWTTPVADVPGQQVGPLAGHLEAPRRQIAPHRGTDGRVLDWTRTTIDEVAVDGRRLLLRQGELQLLAIDLDTGQPLWVLRPPEGRLGPGWAVLPELVALEHLPSAQTLLVDPDTGRILHSVATDVAWSGHAAQPLGAASVVFRGPRGDRLRCLDLRSGAIRWEAPSPSLSPHDQQEWIDGETLLALRGGHGLLRLRAEDGRPAWPYALRWTPDDAAAQWGGSLVLGDTAVWAIERGILRATDRAHGTNVWPRDLPLGPAAGAWRLAQSRGSLVAWTSRVAEGEPIELAFVSPEGQWLQRLPLGDGQRLDRRVRFDPGGPYPLVGSSEGELWRLSPMNEQPPSVGQRVTPVNLRGPAPRSTSSSVGVRSAP